MIAWFIITLMVILCAIFSGVEIAFITSDKMMIEMHRKKSDNIIYKILSEFIKKPSRFLATLLIGHNLALVIYGIYMDEILKPYVSSWVSNGVLILLLQTILSTVIILVLAEYFPKSIFRLKPNKFLAFFALPMYAIYWLLRWVVYLFVGLAKKFLHLFYKIEIKENRPFIGRVELEQYLESRSLDAVEKDMETEVQIYKNVLDFSTLKVKDCMIPRTEIVALELNTDINILSETFIETGLSKILIYKDSVDEIIGFVHHFEMFKSPKYIKNIMLPVGYIPPTMLAKETLNNFIRQQKSVLVVVDEFGGTAGMVTVEDVMEEIFGEIEDEHDVQEHIEEKISENEFLFSGRLEIDYLNEKHNLNIPLSDEYETLAGLLVTHFESIPKELEQVVIHNLEISVVKVSDSKIDLVKIINTEKL